MFLARRPPAMAIERFQDVSRDLPLSYEPVLSNHAESGEELFQVFMIYSDARRRIVDYLGSHEHLAVDIVVSPFRTSFALLFEADMSKPLRYLLAGIMLLAGFTGAVRIAAQSAAAPVQPHTTIDTGALEGV